MHTTYLQLKGFIVNMMKSKEKDGELKSTVMKVSVMSTGI